MYTSSSNLLFPVKYSYGRAHASGMTVVVYNIIVLFIFRQFILVAVVRQNYVRIIDEKPVLMLYAYL